MLSHPLPDEPVEAARLRGEIFSDLDRLAFTLEMEVSALLDEERFDDALARQHVRLGVRLAQRLVTGVWANEVNLRVESFADEYDSRLGAVGSR